MPFKCRSCGKEAGFIEMAGIVIGQIGRLLLVSRGLAPSTQKVSPITIGYKLTRGLLNGFGITCPRCGMVDW